jgi:hypothetical protein
MSTVYTKEGYERMRAFEDSLGIRDHPDSRQGGPRYIRVNPILPKNEPPQEDDSSLEGNPSSS